MGTSNTQINQLGYDLRFADGTPVTSSATLRLAQFNVDPLTITDYQQFLIQASTLSPFGTYDYNAGNEKWNVAMTSSNASARIWLWVDVPNFNEAAVVGSWKAPANNNLTTLDMNNITSAAWGTIGVGYIQLEPITAPPAIDEPPYLSGVVMVMVAIFARASYLHLRRLS
jgi:hypothetical protein